MISLFSLEQRRFLPRGTNTDCVTDVLTQFNNPEPNESQKSIPFTARGPEIDFQPSFG